MERLKMLYNLMGFYEMSNTFSEETKKHLVNNLKNKIKKEY